MKKTHTYIRIAGVLIILGGIVFVGIYTTKQNEEEVKMPTIKGTVACLPLKNTEKVNEANCIRGLKNDAGLYLALPDTPQNELKLGETKSIEGNLKPATANDMYMIAGTVTRN